jgi:DNA-binding XRE family transcriptional regulator
MTNRRSATCTGFCKTREELVAACAYFTDQGLAQSTIATRIGVAKATVARIQNGDVAPEYIEPQAASKQLMAMINDLWLPTSSAQQQPKI